MSEYISREDVINITAETGAWETQNRVRELPATDVQPVRHGRWEYSEKEYGECAWYFCSFCDEPAEQLYNDEPLLSEFCPHCGARMDGDAE